MTKKEPEKAKEKPVSPKAEPSRAKFGRKRLAFFVALAGILLLCGSTGAYAYFTRSHILPNTQISGVDVGGLTKEQATRKLVDKETAFLSRELSFGFEEKNWKVTGKDLDLRFNNDAAVNEAYLDGKTGSLRHQVASLVKSFIAKKYLDVDLQPLTDAGKDALHKKVLVNIETDVSETGLDFVPGTVKVAPGKAGKKVQLDKLQEQFYSLFKNSGYQLNIALSSFEPEVTVTQAESARTLADQILSKGWTVTAGDTKATADPRDVKGWLGTEVARGTDGKATGLNITLKGDAIKQWIASISKVADRPASNAQFKPGEGGLSVVQPDKNGQALQVDSTFEKFKEALLKSADGDHVVVADITTTQADLRADTLESLGIKELIGSGTTDYSGSPVNRRFNIQHGQELLNSQLVKDGETFSTVGKLSPIEESNGWKSELVIKGNRTTPEAGGGLCQVSTTLFRAVLNAGLPIVERTNHSYRVSYYERETGPGLDATIYDPKPDFQWKNDTGHAVYIQSYIVGSKLTFDLYGTKDGRVSDVPKPTILEDIPVGPALYSNTDTLPKGTTKQIETPHNGAKTTVTYTVTRNGEVINKQTFNSYYQPWPAQYLVGTKE